MTKRLELQLQLQHQSFQWVVRVDWFVWSPCYLRDFQESSPAPQFEGINALALCLLYGPAFILVRDHWEEHSPDYMDFCRQSNVSAFQHTLWVCHSFPAKKQWSSDFMAAVTISSDLEPPQRKSVTTSTFSPSIYHEVMQLDAMMLVKKILKKIF